MDHPSGRIASSRGLKKAVLSGNETLAQSVALIAPTAGPLLSVPLVYASAGPGTWFAYVIATVTVVLVALNINQFAKNSASPGSLYSYISSQMHPAIGMIAAWALMIAYIGTAASIAAGLVNYTNVLLHALFGTEVSQFGIGVFGVALAVVLAYRDVKISTRLMLGLEIVSVLLIATVAGGVIIRHGVHPDMSQLKLEGITPDKLRLGLVLAIFSLVGFESATSLGEEAKDPLTTIPRAVKWSGILAGLFFVLCGYSEVLGFHGEAEGLDKSLAPFTVMARNAGMPAFLSILIDVGGVVSFFSCMLACITASARVLYLMAQKGAIHSLLGEAHSSNQTPHRAVVVSGAAVFLPLALLIFRGFSVTDIYGLIATLATFGFLTAYTLVCLAAPMFLKAKGRLTVRDLVISGLALIAMGMAFMGNVYPVPPPPYTYLSYIYLGLLLAGVGWSLISNSRSVAFSERLSRDLDAVAD